MKRILTIIVSAAAVFTALAGCDRTNEFYEVGRQQAFLIEPRNDTTIVLDFEKPDTNIFFVWQNKRHYIEYELLFDTDKDFGSPTMSFPGITTSWRMSYVQLDSVMASQGVPIGESGDLYWKVKVIDPDEGWSEDVFHMNVKRFEIPDNKIMPLSPVSGSSIVLESTESTDGIDFKWTCAAPVRDFRLHVSLVEDFSKEIISEDCREATGYIIAFDALDALLANEGIAHNEEVTLYWKVSGSGDIYMPVESSDVFSFKVRRKRRAPVPLTLSLPADELEIALAEASMAENIVFAWECDTTGVSYSLVLSDEEFGRSWTSPVVSATTYSITQLEMDQLLQKTFYMVPSQVKKFKWKVVPGDTDLCYVKDESRALFIRRFQAASGASPISLVTAPSDGTDYVLDYSNKDSELFNLGWDCDATGVTYVLEYSLNEEMSDSKTHVMGTALTYGVTHAALDDMLESLGKGYSSAKVYWRISTEVSTSTKPSPVRSLELTGMMKPYVDNRDAGAVETYGVVKVGSKVWMSENLRAVKYSDGGSFDSVDMIWGKAAIKTFGNEKVSGQDRGVYYSWPIAIRDYQGATNSTTAQVQGVCPAGWHVASVKDWEDAEAICMGASPMKDPVSWSGNAFAGDNSSGMNIKPSGKFWHAGVAAPDNADDKACFWTPMKNDATTAYMYELFGWSNECVKWYYSSRPFSEGDSIASKLCPVRCVRDY